MGSQSYPALKRVFMKLLIFFMISLSILIIYSISTEEWIIENEWRGSLFAFTSGEYEGQHYLNIYCSSSPCFVNRLGIGGVIYIIFSVLSLIFLLTLVVIATCQIYFAMQFNLCIRYFLSIGSIISFYLGFFLWLLLSQFYIFRTNYKYPVGPFIAFTCSLMYPVAGVAYIKLFNDYIELPQDQHTQEGCNSHEIIIEDNPKMLSIRIEGRYTYEDSVHIEEQESQPS